MHLKPKTKTLTLLKAGFRKDNSVLAYLYEKDDVLDPAAPFF